MAYQDACTTTAMPKAIPAVEAALSDLTNSTEYTENILRELLNRLERVSGAEDLNKGSAGDPDYSCSLACDIQGVQRRVRQMCERISTALSRLAI